MTPENKSSMQIVKKRKGLYPLGGLLTAIALTVGCTTRLNDKLAEVSYDVSATVGESQDTSNPATIGSEHFITPNVPNFENGPGASNTRVPLEGFFYVNCNSVQVLKVSGSERPLPNSYNFEDDKDSNVSYIFTPENIQLKDGSVVNGYSTDRKRALKVNKTQLHDTIQEIDIMIDGEQANQHKNHNKPQDSSLLNNNQIFDSYKFGTGTHNILCEFHTSRGTTYSSSAEVVIFDNRV